MSTRWATTNADNLRKYAATKVLALASPAEDLRLLLLPPAMGGNRVFSGSSDICARTVRLLASRALKLSSARYFEDRSPKFFHN
jgi:hypothetical protein